MNVRVIVENPLIVIEKCKLLDIKVKEQTRISSTKTGLLLGVQKSSDLYELGNLVGSITVGECEYDKDCSKEIEL